VETLEEQLFCTKCGKVNWSNYFEVCICKESDFRFKTYDEYLEAKDGNSL